MPALSTPHFSDVVVIGGGISGLGAAREAAESGLEVDLIEARTRLGGRIWSQTARGLHGAVELGAEFVHGTNPEFKALTRRSGMRLDTVPREIFELRDGRLERSRRYWRSISELLRRIPPNTRKPFTRFLADWTRSVSAADLANLREHVEDFNAATVERMSAAALREDLAGADTRQFRPRDGYSPLVKSLETDLREAGGAIHLGTEVTRVEWEKGAVQVHTRTGEFRAKAAILTLPLGVLKAGSVKFAPSLKAKEALIRRLGWGSVAKVVLRFKPSFWKQRLITTGEAAMRPGEIPFLLATGAEFPVWWVPTSEPLIVGWAGGPRADPLLGRRGQDITRAALRSLATAWGVRISVLRSHLVSSWSHDWASDPYSRGGYSFVASGCETGPMRLAEPVARTLFFAGEATARELGTVHGALASGIDAARQLLSTRSQRRSSHRTEMTASTAV
ncbi:MAG: NAD(P)/FAD-dependent oxidoreductase [Opitutaceae bacterium]|nr:NAD(P)/FAD-dependent oxidoreductase [Opitutaceae bacterium]